MKALDFIKEIANSDLRQIMLRDVGTGADTDNEEQKSNMVTVLGFVNQGLLELYKRFPLKVNTEEVDVEIYNTMAEGVNEGGIIKLPDTALSVVSITNDVYEDIPLDDKHIEFQFKQGVYKKLFVRSIAVNTFVLGGLNEDLTKVVYITYTSAPDTLKLTSNIPLAMAYMEALRNYVAYRGFSTVKSVSPVGDEGLTYLKKFENSCQVLKEMTSTIYDYSNFDEVRLWNRGFV